MLYTNFLKYIIFLPYLFVKKHLEFIELYNADMWKLLQLRR